MMTPSWLAFPPRLGEVVEQQETNFPASDDDDKSSAQAITKTAAKQQRSRRRLSSQRKPRRCSLVPNPAAVAAAAIWNAPSGNVTAPIPTRLSNLPESSSTPLKSSYNHHMQEREIALDDDFQLQRQDVVCGPLCSRETSRQHPGNERFRIISEMRLDRYRKATSRSGKTKLVKEVVEIVRVAGGRFVKQEQDGSWFDIGNLKAREKAGRALRAAVSGLQQRQGYSSSSSTDGHPSAPLTPTGSADADMVLPEHAPSSSVVAAAGPHSPRPPSLHNSALAEFSRFGHQQDAALQRVSGLQQRQGYSSSSSTSGHPSAPLTPTRSAGTDMVVPEDVPFSSVVAATGPYSPQPPSPHNSALAEFSRFGHQQDQHYHLPTTSFMLPPLLQGQQQSHGVHDDLFPDPISSTSHRPGPPDGFHDFVRSTFLGFEVLRQDPRSEQDE
jgi:hypothetical protein